MSAPDSIADPSAAFTGISGSSVQASDFSSIMQSLASAHPAGATTTTTATGTAQSSATGASASSSTRSSTKTAGSSNASLTAASGSTGTSKSSSQVSTTLLTSTTAAQSVESSISGTAGQHSSTAAASAASNTAAADTVKSKCDSVSCDSGLQAAIAVPVVIGVLLLIGLIIFLARRRRRRPRSPPPPLNEKEKPKKKWSRHLRVFSFGEELLMGGRFSSTNSLRTGETGSMRSGQPSSHGAQEGSIHSVEEVAPPYRDTVSQAERPTITTDPFPRPSSTATAPPPYAPAALAAGRTSRATNNNRPTTPISNRSRTDPFRDAGSPPVSPIEGSPFNDPDDDDEAQSPRPLMSRQSSTRRALSDIQSETSTLHGSDAGSIRQATLIRNVSMSGARTVDVNRSGNQRTSDHS